MHLDEEEVQRLLHGQLSRPVEESAQAHLAACPDCRGRVALAEREEGEVYALLRRVDHPPPLIHADAIAARARSFRVGRLAAGVLLAVGLAGAAYATPGSPLPGWLDSLADWIGGAAAPGPRAPAEVQGPEPAGAGIAVAPGRNLLILFRSSQADGQVQVTLTEGTDVVVRAPLGAATFTTDVDRLVIDNEGSVATFEILIPRTAPRVEIRVLGDRIFLKEGARVTTRESLNSRGAYILPLRPPGPS